jgi:uncharacterized RDD family membrane protein YckC
MSETPQTPQHWQKYWQEQGQYENTLARAGTGQMPYAFGSHPLDRLYASWLARVGASLIDGVLAFLVACMGGIPVGILAAVTGDTGVIYLAYVVGFVVALWFPWRNGSVGQTPGKKMLGIMVVHEETGQLVGGPAGLLRWFVGFVISLITLGIGGLLDSLWPLWDKRSQTLHDKVVHTVVVETPRY